jgi:hypothetical protein
MSKLLRVILFSLCLVFSFASQSTASVGSVFPSKNLDAQEGGPPAQVPEAQPDTAKQKTTKTEKKATKKEKKKKAAKKEKKEKKAEQGPPPDRVPQ